jgi:hypothetical protein
MIEALTYLTRSSQVQHMVPLTIDLSPLAQEPSVLGMRNKLHYGRLTVLLGIISTN